MRKLIALIVLFAAAAPAWSQLQVGVNQAFGDHNYRQTNADGLIGYGSWSLAPSLNFYSADTTPGTFTTLQARLGYDYPLFGVGLTGGGTLQESGYSNLFGGADIAMSLTPTGLTAAHRIGGPGNSYTPAGRGLARVDLGIGGLVTQVKQSGVTTLDQGQVYGYVGANFLGALLSARLTKFDYDHDLTTTVVPPPYYNPLDGQLNVNNNYPNLSLHLMGQASLLPFISPYLSYVRTTYEQVGSFQPGQTDAWTVGVKVGLDIIEVDASASRVFQTGGSDVSFANIGAGLRF